MSYTRERTETGTLQRFFKWGLILRTDAGHPWFLKVDERRADFLIGLRVTVKGKQVGPVLTVTSIVQASD